MKGSVIGNSAVTPSFCVDKMTHHPATSYDQTNMTWDLNFAGHETVAPTKPRGFGGCES